MAKKTLNYIDTLIGIRRAIKQLQNELQEINPIAHEYYPLPWRQRNNGEPTLEIKFGSGPRFYRIATNVPTLGLNRTLLERWAPLIEETPA